MSTIPVGLFVAVGGGVIVLALALAVVFGVLHLRRRHEQWRDLAARRGLVYVDGDPFDLADAAGGRVRMTLHAPPGGPRFALVGVWPTGSDAGTVPAVVAWSDDLPVHVRPDLHRWRVHEHPRHGRLVTLRARTRWRGGGVASAAEAGEVLDEFLRTVHR